MSLGPTASRRTFFKTSSRFIAVLGTAMSMGATFVLPAQSTSTTRQPASADQKFGALIAMAEARLKEYGIPGAAIGVAYNGQVQIAGVGITNIEDARPISAHTVFPIASISKTFAATAMMRLVEEGKVDLRAPVRTYLPELVLKDSTVARDVTVWHLLTHLGGWEGQISGPDRGSETLSAFVAAMPDVMQVAPLSAAWSYNNAGFSIAGRVIERVTNMSINNAIRSLVFQPLGLEHAGTTAGEFIVNPFASGHLTRNGVATLQRPFVPSTSITAGGIGLCMADLMTYARFHLGDGTAQNGTRILTAASLQSMRAAQLHKQGTDDDIGIAWHLRNVNGVRTASHGGTLAGHNLLLEIAPDRQFAIAILTNSNAGWRLIQDVEREALKSYLGATYAMNQGIAHRGVLETLPAVTPLATQPNFAPYVGTYARPTNTVVVRAEGKVLTVQTVPNTGTPQTPIPVAFFGEDRTVVLDGADKGQTIEFVRDGTGKIMWVRVVGRVAVRTQ